MTTNLSGRRSQARIGGAAIDHEIDRALAELTAERDQRYREARAAADTDRALQGSITHEQLRTAVDAAPSGVAIRDHAGWHVLLRLNAKSVTIPGPWGGTRLVPIDHIREVRA